MRVRIALAGLLLLAALGASSAKADDANQECANNDDVTIVIDFQSLGGGVNVRCAPQDVPTGRAAFVRADIAFQDYRGFVCRISGLPKNGPCNTYPPASAYWVYWLAQRGGEWCASNLGFDARRPPNGAIEGWSFAKDSNGNAPPPRYPVPAAIPGTTPHPLNGGDCDATGEITPPTTTTTHAPAGPGPSTPSPTEAPSVETTASTRRGATTTSSSSTVVTAVGETTTSRQALSLGATTSSVPFGDVDLSLDHENKKGFPWGVVAGGGLVAGIVGVGVVTALRRRNEFG